MVKSEKARVFMSGRSQAVRIPAAYRFKTEEVYIRRDPKSGAVTLSERPERVPLKDVFAMIDAAGGAEELFGERDTRLPEQREWL